MFSCGTLRRRYLIILSTINLFLVMHSLIFNSLHVYVILNELKKLWLPTNVIFCYVFNDPFWMTSSSFLRLKELTPLGKSETIITALFNLLQHFFRKVFFYFFINFVINARNSLTLVCFLENWDYTLRIVIMSSTFARISFNWLFFLLIFHSFSLFIEQIEQSVAVEAIENITPNEFVVYCEY